MAWFMGIDIGSCTSKGVITENGTLSVYHILQSGINYKQTARTLREELLAKANLTQEEITGTVTTGHSGGDIPFGNGQVTDMRCCARGINRIFPSARTVIDVQGQFTQIIRISEEGRVINFVVSEKCAAGSGSFLDIVANVLQIKLDQVGPLSLKSENPVAFTTGCAVFGESEAVSRVAEGSLKEDILAGIHKALADKIASLVDRVGLEEKCVISGGGGLNIGLIRKIEDSLGISLLVPSQPQIVNAYGAAIIAEEEYNKGR
ncbi:acyl-CoA dehydratase activase [Chloroflexota bacterium]